MRFAIKVFYEGRGFHGSQRQPGKRTVEGVLLSALEELNIDYSNFRGAGRTDKGVSALGNVFAFNSSSEILEPRVINSVLHQDMRVLSVREVNDGFNPRHAEKRIYRYFLIDQGFDLDAMKEAAEELCGEHSFHNFSAPDYRNPIRRLYDTRIEERGGALVITYEGQSFLWQMVRRMTSALCSVGMNSIKPLEIREYFDLERKEKFPPSPPENLVLWDIIYSFAFKDERYTRKRLKKELEKRLTQSYIEAGMWGEMLGQIR